MSSGMPIGGVLLAAGAGRRYGMPKALVTWQGRPLAARALTTLLDSGCAPVVVVLGAEAERVRRDVELAGAVVVTNPEWSEGMGSSLRAGLLALARTSVTAAVVLLVDTPGITPEAVRRVCALASPEALVQASYDGLPGHPVLLGRQHWAQIAELAVGDVGARPYLSTHADRVLIVECGDVSDGSDLDRAG
jgi:CTP:molybdopterin cytidylyltransferase MocA